MRVDKAAGALGAYIQNVSLADAAASSDLFAEIRAALLSGHVSQFGPFAEADVAHLGETADGEPQALADGVDAGDQGGGHGAHAGRQDPQFTRGGLDFSLLRHVQAPLESIRKNGSAPDQSGAVQGNALD